MKLSEFDINPIWDKEKKLYNNEITKDQIDLILYNDLEDNNAFCEYGILLGISRKVEAIARSKIAAKLYKEGRIKKILITGGKNGISSKGKNQTPVDINLDNPNISELYADEYSEGYRMKLIMEEYAEQELKITIPEENIILDEESNNTIENMQFAKKIFSNLKDGDSIIIITSGYHVRRAIGTALKHLLDKINYCPVVANTGYFEKDNYYKTPLGMLLSSFDANRCVEQARNGIIADIEITKKYNNTINRKS